jgi:hypothetical protein
MSFDWRNFIEVERDHVSLVNKYEYLHSKGLAEYEAEALALLGLRRLPTRNDVNIIEQIIPDSWDDMDRKEKQQCYYIANVVCFLKMMKSMFNAAFIRHLKTYKPNGKDDILINNYHSLLEHLLFDSIFLFNIYERCFLERRSRYAVGKSGGKHPVTLYWSLKQMIFGQASFHCGNNLNADASPAFIRQVIELRIRRAFGIFYLCNKMDNRPAPISMTQIFDILNRHNDKFRFAVPLHAIRRIYSWSNYFVHAGIRDLLWKSIKAAAFIEGLVIAKRTRPSVNVNEGIALDSATLEQIRKEAREIKGDGYELIGCDPEAVIIPAP